MHASLNVVYETELLSLKTIKTGYTYVSLRHNGRCHNPWYLFGCFLAVAVKLEIVLVFLQDC